MGLWNWEPLLAWRYARTQQCILTHCWSPLWPPSNSARITELRSPACISLGLCPQSPQFEEWLHTGGLGSCFYYSGPCLPTSFPPPHLSNHLLWLLPSACSVWPSAKHLCSPPPCYGLGFLLSFSFFPERYFWHANERLVLLPWRLSSEFAFSFRISFKSSYFPSPFLPVLVPLCWVQFLDFSALQTINIVFLVQRTDWMYTLLQLQEKLVLLFLFLFSSNGSGGILLKCW